MRKVVQREGTLLPI